MMIIDVRKLNAQKKYKGSLEFDYSAPEELIGIPFVKFASPVKIRFDYELFEDDSLEIFGEILYRIEGRCSRCLNETATDVKGEIDAYFQPVKNAEDYSYSGGVIDLTQAVHEAIMASMPYVLSCGSDCQSIPFSSETKN